MDERPAAPSAPVVASQRSPKQKIFDLHASDVVEIVVKDTSAESRAGRFACLTTSLIYGAGWWMAMKGLVPVVGIDAFTYMLAGGAIASAIGVSLWAFKKDARRLERIREMHGLDQHQVARLELAWIRVKGAHPGVSDEEVANLLVSKWEAYVPDSLTEIDGPIGIYGPDDEP